MRILVIEDETKVAQALKKGLTAEGFAVDAVGTFEDGLGMARTEDYDLLIVDRMLPGAGEGLDIIRQLREMKKTVPALVLTAKDATGERVAGLTSGADDYLIKPFAFEELLARVRALLRRPTNMISDILEVKDLKLNVPEMIVERQGQAILLTKTEFSLLEYLMRNQGRILSKDAIINHVWDYDADILPNTVEVYIGYLRQKIEEPFAGEPLIQTRRGFGYTINRENV